MVAYKVLKILSKEDRETVRLNLVTEEKWVEHCKELWCDPNDSQEATGEIRKNICVGAITIEELERALSFMKTGRHLVCIG